MVQTFIMSFASLRKYQSRALVVIFAVVLGFLFIVWPAPACRILNIQNYLITVGGIISAFVIAHLSTKMFDVRRERSIIKAEFDALSDKLTLFRKLLNYVMKSPDFWVKYDDIKKFKRDFSLLNFERLHTDERDPLRQKYWDEGTDLDSDTIDLYMAMEALVGQDPNAFVNYSIDHINQYYEPSNQIWYWFDKHRHGNFNDKGLWKGYESQARDCISRIDERHKSQDFHREILGSLAADFHGLYFPRMYVLIREHIGLPKSLSSSLQSLFVMMLFGVLFPIVLQSISVPDNWNVRLTLFFVWVTSLALLTFMLEFYRFLNADTAVIKQE